MRVYDIGALHHSPLGHSELKQNLPSSHLPRIFPSISYHPLPHWREREREIRDCGAYKRDEEGELLEPHPLSLILIDRATSSHHLPPLDQRDRAAAMAPKRIHDGFEKEDPDQPNEKRMHRLPSFSTVIREAMMMKHVQNVFMVMEPLLRRVVQEEIQAGLVRSPRYIERSSPETPSIEPATWKLAFLNPPILPIFTGSKIEDVTGNPLRVILVDADTGSPSPVPQFLRVELVPVFGDFPKDDREEWSADEFSRCIVKERAGKRPLLTGDVGLTMRDGRVAVPDLQFTDNSSWVRCRKFRIGVRVVPGSYDGARIGEALTEAFNVRDHRGELYKKHYPPALTDEVWRLEKIGKGGAFHKKLAHHGVRNVQEFLRMLMVKPDMLRVILGDGMTDRMWEATTSHARTCAAGDKVYAYSGQHGGTVYVNSVCELVRIEFGGVERAQQQLSRGDRAYVHQLWLEAYEQRGRLQEADIDADAEQLLHGNAAAANLPMLQDAGQVVLPPPSAPATPLWFQNSNQEIDVQIVDELTPASFGAFQWPAGQMFNMPG